MFTIIGGDGKEYGPVSAEQIRGWIAAGRANLDTQAKAVGSADWRRLGDFPEFSPGASGGPPSLAAASTGTTDVLAGRGQRFGAFIVDRVLEFIVSIPGGILLGTSVIKALVATGQGEEPNFEDMDMGRLMGGIALLGLSLLALLIVQIWMLSTRGQTIGKRLFDIKVVMFADGGKASFLNAWLLRNFVPGIISAIPYIGFLFMLVDYCFIFSAERRCLHDLIAGTKVIEAGNRSGAAVS